MTAEPRDVVRAFYSGVVDRDAGALAGLLESSFHDDAWLEWPDGLPYGGRVEGVRALGKVLAGLVADSTPLGPENLQVVSMVDGGGQIAAQLEFDWRAGEQAIPSGALELWTFDAGLVREIRAYYWDTAACHALFQANKPPSA